MNTRRLLRAKIHRATVTHANLDYEGSITISPELMSAADLVENEAVSIWDVSNGHRLETYVIKGDEGSSDICINGAAAHLISAGDIVIIAAFTNVIENDVREHHPLVVFVDQHNKILGRDKEIPGPRIREETVCNVTG